MFGAIRVVPAGCEAGHASIATTMRYMHYVPAHATSSSAQRADGRLGSGGRARTGPGGALDIEGGKLTGPITATSASAVRICGTTSTGPLTISGSTGPVLIGGPTANGPCAATMITGPATLTGNTAGVQIVGASVIGPLRVTNNNGGTTVTGNTVIGPLTVTGNTGTVTHTPNTVLGPSTLQ